MASRSRAHRMAGIALDLPSIMWSNARSCDFFVPDPRVQLHIFENSTLVNDNEIWFEVFFEQTRFAGQGLLSQ